MSRARVLLTASGGGHTGFAIAVARKLPGDVELVFSVARGDVWSLERIATLGRDVVIVEHARGRGPLEGLARAAPRLGLALLESLARLPRVDVALCTGHNNSLPPCIAARMKGARLVSLEDVYRVHTRSRAVSLLSRLSEAVALHWPVQEKLYPGKGVVVGPVYEPPKYKPWDGGYILVTAGSYGYKELFDAIIELWREGRLGEVRLTIQTGRVPPDEYRQAGAEAFQFDPDIERYIAGASLVITHQGLTAILSALGYGKPTIIAYNPRWKLAAPPEDVRTVAEMLGLEFVPTPDPARLEESIQRAKPPQRRYKDGSARLANLLLNLAFHGQPE